MTQRNCLTDVVSLWSLMYSLNVCLPDPFVVCIAWKLAEVIEGNIHETALFVMTPIELIVASAVAVAAEGRSVMAMLCLLLV